MDRGKHEGKELTDIPRGYLRYCLREWDCSAELRRGIMFAVAGQSYEPLNEEALLEAIVKPLQK